MMDDGATTVWEAVDMINIADTSRGVASYNHPMQGSFMYSVVTELCGLNPEEPAFTKLRFAPKNVSRVNKLSASVTLICGRVDVDFERENDKCVYTLKVPAGITAIIDTAGEITVDGIKYDSTVEIGSGMHRIITCACGA